MKISEILLTEAVFNTDAAVDFIYDIAYKYYVDELKKWMNGKQIAPIGLRNVTFDSEELLRYINDPAIRRALALNPIRVAAGISDGGNIYSPRAKTVFISFNAVLHKMIYEALIHNRSFEEFLTQFDKRHHANITQELRGETVKGSIAHEISHWMTDTFHNQHISKLVMKAGAATNIGRRQDIMNKGEVNTYMTDYEIDAQVHAIRQLRRPHTQASWDLLTLDDLLDASPPMRTVVDDIARIDRSQLSRYFKLLLRRLHRERLLGKNMHKITRY
jgi:hypothetical protein